MRTTRKQRKRFGCRVIVFFLQNIFRPISQSPYLLLESLCTIQEGGQPTADAFPSVVRQLDANQTDGKCLHDGGRLVGNLHSEMFAREINVKRVNKNVTYNVRFSKHNVILGKTHAAHGDNKEFAAPSL